MAKLGYVKLVRLLRETYLEHRKQDEVDAKREKHAGLSRQYFRLRVVEVLNLSNFSDHFRFQEVLPESNFKVQ